MVKFTLKLKLVINIKNSELFMFIWKNIGKVIQHIPTIKKVYCLSNHLKERLDMP